MMLLPASVRWQGASLALSVCLLLLCFLGRPSIAAAFTEASRYELGLRLGYAQTCKAREKLHFYSLLPRWGIFLTRPDNPYLGKLRFSFLVEGIVSALRDGSWGGDFGFTPLLKISYPLGPVLFYLEGGAGMIWENIDSPTYAHRFNFSPQAGAGLDIRIYRTCALTLAYRFRHTSNAGLYAENPGVNSNFFLLGLTHYF